MLGNVNNANNVNPGSNSKPPVSRESSKDKKQKIIEKKIPSRKIKKEDPNKKEYFSNQPLSHQGSNLSSGSKNNNKDKLKVKEVYIKMNDFDAKLEINKKRISNEAKQAELPKRPQSAFDKENLLKHKKSEIMKNISLSKDDDIMDEYIKYNINKKILENPDIQNIEKAKMIIPRADKLTRNESKGQLKSTNIFLNDDKKRTDFFKDLNINLNLRDSKFDNAEISRYVDNYLKASNIDISLIMNDNNFNKKASISEFISQNKEETISGQGELNSYLDNLMREFKNYQELKNDASISMAEGDDSRLEKYKNIMKDKKVSRKQMKVDETVDNIQSIPLYKKDTNYDFSVCYINESGQQDSYSINKVNPDNGAIGSTENTTDLENNFQGNIVIKEDYNDSYEENSDDYYEEDEEEEDEYYETDEEAVEMVKDFKNNTEVTEKTNDEMSNVRDKKIKELDEIRQRFLEKIEWHKNELKKISGEVDFNKIYQAYQSDEVLLEFFNTI